eukprot:g55822.t1
MISTQNHDPVRNNNGLSFERCERTIQQALNYGGRSSIQIDIFNVACSERDSTAAIPSPPLPSFNSSFSSLPSPSSSSSSAPPSSTQNHVSDNHHETKEERQRRLRREYQRRKRQNPTSKSSRRNEERRARYQETKDSKNEEKRVRCQEIKESKNDERKTAYHHSDHEIQEVKNVACSEREFTIQSSVLPSFDLSVSFSSEQLSSSSSSFQSSSICNNVSNNHESKEETKRRLRTEYQRRRRQNLAVRVADNAAARQRRLQAAEVRNEERRARYHEMKDGKNEERRARYQEMKDGKNEERRARYQELKDGKNEERRARYHEMKDSKNEERRARYQETKDNKNKERRIVYHSDPEIQEVKNARRRARQTGRNPLYKIACAHVTTFDENGTMLLARHEDDKLGTPFDSPNQRCPFCGAWFWKHELNPNLRANQQFTDRMAARHCRSCCSNGYVRLDRLPPLPTDLLNLFILHGPVERYFRQHIRSFNSCFSFASIKADQLQSQVDLQPLQYKDLRTISSALYSRTLLTKRTFSKFISSTTTNDEQGGYMW